MRIPEVITSHGRFGQVNLHTLIETFCKGGAQKAGGVIWMKDPASPMSQTEALFRVSDSLSIDTHEDLKLLGTKPFVSSIHRIPYDELTTDDRPDFDHLDVTVHHKGETQVVRVEHLWLEEFSYPACQLRDSSAGIVLHEYARVFVEQLFDRFGALQLDKNFHIHRVMGCWSRWTKMPPNMKLVKVSLTYEQAGELSMTDILEDDTPTGEVPNGYILNI